jgi:hypothetical protein
MENCSREIYLPVEESFKQFLMIRSRGKAAGPKAPIYEKIPFAMAKGR